VRKPQQQSLTLFLALPPLLASLGRAAPLGVRGATHCAAEVC
jgi:hypothetical protein